LCLWTTETIVRLRREEYKTAFIYYFPHAVPQNSDISVGIYQKEKEKEKEKKRKRK